MEFFLKTGEEHQLSILSININGKLSKLQLQECVEFFNHFDIAILIELENTYTFSVPDFTASRSRGDEMMGGVAVLFKNQVWR